MELTINTGTKEGSVSALLDRPANARSLLVLAHGAGAGMRHRFMEAMVRRLGSHGVATLRYQFPYIEAGRRAPDRPPVLVGTVRSAVEEAGRIAPGIPLFAGGKSMGGRMTSSAAARAALPEVRGLLFLGFPLHAPGKAGDGRADHLAGVQVPMLFIQGTRDSLAELPRITAVTERLGPRATLMVIEGGDHSFAVPKRSGRDGEAVLDEIAVAMAGWMADRG